MVSLAYPTVLDTSHRSGRHDLGVDRSQRNGMLVGISFSSLPHCIRSLKGIVRGSKKSPKVILRLLVSQGDEYASWAAGCRMTMKGKPLAKQGYEQELSSLRAFVAMQNKADGGTSPTGDHVSSM